MNKDYSYALKRLEKLRKTFDHLINHCSELQEANKKLRANDETNEQLLAAQERLLKQFDKSQPPQT